MAEEGWDLEAITAKWQARWWKEGIQHADRPGSGSGGAAPRGSAAHGGPKAAHDGLGAERSGAPKPSPPHPARPSGDGREENVGASLRSKSTFFIHFAYPGISGFLHVGHMRGFTYTDVFARFKRMTGHQVLFPAGFHASGIPAVAFAAEVKRGEKTEYLRSNGYDGPIEALAEPRAVVNYFAKVYTNDYWKRFGFLIDERRNCTTIDPAYSRFIQWQFRALAAKGMLVQKPHYAPYCPVAGPVAVDKSETDIKQGGSAEILEFVALKFRLPAGTVHAEPVVLPCATLRPETVFGCTNVWVHPEQEYFLVRVWEDGKVQDTDRSEVWAVSQRGQVKLEWQFERAVPLHQKVSGRDLVVETATVPVTGRKVPIVAGSFVDPQIATGVVMSVPGHAPFDYAAYRDAGLLEALGPPPVIVTVEGQKGIPAEEACRRHKVTNQGDRGQLDAATEELYSDEFNKGVLGAACGPYAGKRVKAVKDQIKADLVSIGAARILRQFSEPVVSRAGEVVDIRRVPDQDFIHYADKAWTEKAKAHAATMDVHPQRYKEELPNVLDWFGDRACVRRGAWLGTEFPFKPGWIVEPIADSTFYSWFYLVQRYLRSEWNPTPPGGGLALEELTDAFFEFAFNGRGRPARALWEEVRRDVLFWGPVDINLGGKEHQTVHFPVYVMTNVALLDDPALWPRGIFVNWWVTQKAGAKISKSKGGAEPIPGAAARYGVDAMRLYYCHVGSPHVDIEWDPDLVLGYRARVERITRQVDDALAAGGGARPMDAWLEAAFARALAAARAAYESYDLRTAATELAYTVPDLLRWYARRGGGDAVLLRRVVREWAQGLCPMLPHLGEEMFERAGGRGLCTASGFPSTDTRSDEPAILAEEYLQMVLEDIQAIRKMANLERPQSLVLFTSPGWKTQVARIALQHMREGPDGGGFQHPQFMKEVMADPALRARKEAAAFAGKMRATLMATPSAGRKFLRNQLDEKTVLSEAASFIAAELGLADVPVYASDDPDAPDHPKRAVSAPLKPGIAIS